MPSTPIRADKRGYGPVDTPQICDGEGRVLSLFQVLHEQ